MFFRNVAKRTAFIGWLIAALSLTSVPQASAVQTIFYDGTGGGGCSALLAGNSIYASKLIATSSNTVNTIKVWIGNGTQTNFSTSRYYIMANNPTGGSPQATGAPSTVLATFTPDLISGTGSSTVAKYVGSYTVSSGTTYWIAAAQSASSFPMCYRSTSNTSSLVMNGFVVDTSTAGNNNAWNRAYVTGGTNPVGASWSVGLPDALAWQFTLESNTSEPVVATIGTQSGASKADYRTVTPLTVSVDTQSKVTFYVNGKVIAGCRNILSSAGTATCNWRPSVHGSFRIYATANPISNSYVASTTSTIYVGVVARTNRR
jgi:hypothetical protein